MSESDESTAGGFFIGVLMAMAVFVLFNVIFFGVVVQTTLNNRYCTDFARVFQVNVDGTWECVEE